MVNVFSKHYKEYLGKLDTIEKANADQSSFRKAKEGGIERVKRSFLQM